MLNILKKYLVLNNYSSQKDLFEDAFLSHPNYPSLYAVTDSLDSLSIENLAVKIPKDQFNELPEFFLSLFKEELVLVNKDKTALLIENEKGIKINLSVEEFLNDWSQIILVVESNLEKNTLLNSSYSTRLLYLTPLVLLILFSVFINNFTINSFFLLGTTVLGLLVSVLILQEKFGVKTEIVSKLCNISSETSCDSVIKSDKSQIVKGLSFFDLPILFFGVNFLSLLLSPIFSSVIISLLSLLAIPFLLYSIWLQKSQIKKWCLLCLTVSAIIFVQGIPYLVKGVSLDNGFISGVIMYLMCVVIVGAIWFFVRPLLENEVALKNELNLHKRFKRNFKVFRFLTKKVDVQEGYESLKGITYGDSNAPVKLSFFLSPSCGHCHKAFKDALSLFEKNKDKVYLKVLFNVNPENNGNKYLSIVQTLLGLSFSDEVMARKALEDWHGKNLDFEVWKEKWHSSSYDMLVNTQMQKQYEWCLANNFNYTPVKLVNNELFPNEYEVVDLQYFINDYIEEFSSLQNDESLKIV
jgi:uncharacterized membrane protein